MIVTDIARQARVILRHTPAVIRRRLLGIFAFTTLMGFVELGVAGLVSLLGVALASPQSVLGLRPVKMAVQAFPGLGHIASDPARLLTAILLLTVLVVSGKNILLGSLTYKQSRYGYELSTALGGTLFRSFLSKDYLWHLEQNAAELLTAVSYRIYVKAYAIALLTLLTQAVVTAFLITGGLVLAPLPSLTVICLAGLTAAWSYKFSRRRMRKHNAAIAEVELALNKDALAGLHGLRDMRVYQREAAVNARIEGAMERITHETAMAATLPTLPALVLESTGMFTLLLALIAMIALNSSQAAITGALALLAAMAWRLLPSMNRAVSAVVSLQGYKPYLDIFFKSFAENAAIPPSLPEARPPLPFARAVALEGVSFRYPQGKREALRAVNLTLSKGGKVGVIGPSGAGKSTLIGLLTGLLVPDSGALSVDGTPIGPMNYGGFRALIGYVPQAPYLLDASLAENVAFSRWGEPIDEERVKTACRLAAVNFWEQLPSGLHTRIGERGVSLSGGQAQRVAIARALYADPLILVFDEATSSLDSATEGVIQQTINALRDDITVLIVAHRLSTVERCDVVYWLEDGEIRAEGKPAEVLAAYGRWAAQAGMI
jgi:ABC-type multidrug transport system fused ATPase/permease subunit